MKVSFPGYYQPTQDEFTDLWSKGTFTLDANVLLNLYRYTPSTCSEFFKILDRISDRLWVSHQVALEYQRNRLNVIDQQKRAYSEVINSLVDAQNKIEGKLNEYSRHPYINAPNLIKKVKSSFVRITDELELDQKKHPDLISDDSVRTRITELLRDKVGSQYTEEKLNRIYLEGEKRYLENIPPGYKDARDKKDNNRYSDLVLWFQIMDRAKEAKTPVIFVSDDTKEDWWWIFSGKVIGPRPELIAEFLKYTEMNIYIYPSDRFMEYAKEYLMEHVGQKAIDEVRDIRQAEEDKDLRDSRLNAQILETSELGRLVMNWKEVIANSPQELHRTVVGAILRSAGIRPLAIKNDDVILGVRYPVHREILERPENTAIAEAIISNFLGHQCHVRWVTELGPVSKPLSQEG